MKTLHRPRYPRITSIHDSLDRSPWACVYYKRRLVRRGQVGRLYGAPVYIVREVNWPPVDGAFSKDALFSPNALR